MPRKKSEGLRTSENKMVGWISEMERIDALNKAMLEFTLAALPPGQTEMLEMIQQGIAQEGVAVQARRMFLNK